MRHPSRAKLPGYSVATKLRFADVAAMTLAVACALNVNGMLNMALNVGQAASVVMLIAALFLIFRPGRPYPQLPQIMFAISIVSYLAFGAVFSLGNGTFEGVGKYFQSYAGGLLIAWGIADYVAESRVRNRLKLFVILLRNLFLISAASVWFSPVLYKIFVNIPPSFYYRMGGFFGNPNEAAVCSLFALVLIFAFPFQRRGVNVSAIILICGSTILTLSKLGIVTMIMLLTWYLIRQATIRVRVVVIFLAILLTMGLQEAGQTTQAIINNPSLNLSESQKKRLADVSFILEGRLNSQTTTGRTYIWGMALKEISARFPAGGGLGSGHFITGGVLEAGVWQGTHNSFLMILSESGPLSLVLFLAAWIILVIRAATAPARGLLLPLVLVLTMDLMSSHGSLGVRFNNLMWGAALGLAAMRSSRHQVAARGPKPQTDDYRRGQFRPRADPLAWTGEGSATNNQRDRS